MPADVEGLVREVVADLLPDADVAFGVEGGFAVTVAVGGEVVCTAYADDGAPSGEVAAHVANVVQDAAVVLLRRAVPGCPGHEHPAVARPAGAGIAWSCPATGDVLATRPVTPCGTLGG